MDFFIQRSELSGKSKLRIGLILFCIFPVLLCSCATRDSIPPELPAEIELNKDAGHSEPILATLRLKSGEKLVFFLDTGSPFTVLDKSLESKLGKRTGTKRLSYAYYGKTSAAVCQTPPLYWNNTRLKTDRQVVVDDLSRIFTKSRVDGILGMDCLRHYCLQIDFAAGRIRFLDPDRSENQALGKAYPLHLSRKALWFQADFLWQTNSRFYPDTGNPFDGELKAVLFQQALDQHQPVKTYDSTNTPGATDRVVRFQESSFDGMPYSDLLVGEYPSQSSYARNLMGLRFLARHLVTLNFPARTMYLKRIRSGACPEDESLADTPAAPP